MRCLPVSALGLSGLVAFASVRLTAAVAPATTNITVSGNLTITVTANSTAADAAWQQVLRKHNPPTISPKPGDENKTDAQRRQEAQAAKVQQAREAAQVTRDFISQFPNSVYVGRARKLAAMSALRGVADDDKAQEQNALRAAGDYRANTANHPLDRFEVAELAERIAARGKKNGSPFAKNTSEDEMIADKLRSEFGDLPEVFRVYGSVARDADMDTAKRLAEKIVASGASKETKADAAAILSRHLLVGRRIGAVATTADGKELNFSKPLSRTTVILVWSSVNPDALGSLPAQTVRLLQDLQVLYFTMGASPDGLKSLAMNLPVPGVVCTDTPGKAPRMSERLRIQQAPYAYVLTSDGTVAGFGPVEEIPALVARIGK